MRDSIHNLPYGKIVIRKARLRRRKPGGRSFCMVGGHLDHHKVRHGPGVLPRLEMAKKDTRTSNIRHLKTIGWKIQYEVLIQACNRSLRCKCADELASLLILFKKLGAKSSVLS